MYPAITRNFPDFLRIFMVSMHVPVGINSGIETAKQV